MYNKFFGLAEAPFNITPDSKFLFLSQRHREALSALLYGIKERKGFILLTGDIGSGKTTLCRALVHELRQEDIKLALILNPGLSEVELLKAVNDEFRIPSFYDTKKGLIDELNRFLIAENQRGSNVVLVIDEAQNLQPGLLEEIRMLSNLETEKDKLIQIVLIGQPELNDTLRLSQLEQLEQRVSVRFHITPLTEEEMLAYIKHRLFVARAKIEIEFTEPALKQLYNATRGVPRKINVLCDRALLACYVDGSYTVDERIVQKAIQEVAGDHVTRAKKKARKVALVEYLSQRILTRTVAIWAAAAMAVFVLVSGAIAVGIRIANVHAQEDPGLALAGKLAEAKPVDPPKTEANLRKGKSRKPTAEVTAAGETSAPKAAPTPTPDWKQIRRKKPNWQYDPDAPLVRVNNPKVVFRAAQLSMLKMWGIAVDLAEMAKLSEDLVVNGELSGDAVRIRQVPISGEYHEAIRLNVPLIVKIKNPTDDQSEYVVLLKAEGEAVTVGDPIWGIKTFKTHEFMKRWNGASAVFVDTNSLTKLQRGDRNEHVRTLQQYLHDQKYLDEVTGVYDVKTTEAIKKLQSYYKLKESGQLDDLTLMILNSRMMRNGPRLNSADSVD